MKKLYWNFENHALKFPHLSVFCVFLFSIQQETNCTKRWQSTWGIKKLISWKMTWLCVTFCAAEFECYFFIMLCVKAWINVTKRLRGDSDVDGTCIPQVWISSFGLLNIYSTNKLSTCEDSSYSFIFLHQVP